jgi:pSer/pThr/pTyr-binding forkhead associated (FHA) protein
MDYQLVVVRGRSASRTLKLGKGITTVGRHEDCQLRIGSSQVSRKHCQLFEKNGTLVVLDLGSSNGTFVNGKRIDGQEALAPGDVLSLGKVKLRIEKLGTAGPAPAAKKPSDTAVAEAVLLEEGGDDEEFEIDFDDEPEAPAAASPDTPAAAKPGAEPEPTATLPTSKAAPEMADEAVADFLMGIDLDDEDKR